ncbi:MAG: hypothetical protein ABFD04_05365 [Syntrophomonas sp.]
MDGIRTKRGKGRCVVARNTGIDFNLYGYGGFVGLKQVKGAFAPLNFKAFFIFL